MTNRIGKIVLVRDSIVWWHLLQPNSPNPVDPSKRQRRVRIPVSIKAAAIAVSYHHPHHHLNWTCPLMRCARPWSRSSNHHRPKRWTVRHYPKRNCRAHPVHRPVHRFYMADQPPYHNRIKRATIIWKYRWNTNANRNRRRTIRSITKRNSANGRGSTIVMIVLAAMWRTAMKRTCRRITNRNFDRKERTGTGGRKITVIMTPTRFAEELFSFFFFFVDLKLFLFLFKLNFSFFFFNFFFSLFNAS